MSNNYNRSFFTSFYGKKILKIAVDDDFINFKIDSNNIPLPNSIFTFLFTGTPL